MRRANIWIRMSIYTGIFLLFGFVFIYLLNIFYPVNTKISYSVLVLDTKDNPLHVFQSEDQKWRFQTSLSDIDSGFVNLLLAKEDQWFYWHFGVNPLAIVRASFQNMFSAKRVSGASTLTMQVIRLLEPRSRTFLSKSIEIVRAMQLELILSKQQILELYCTLAPYGGNIEGIRAASLIYLGHLPRRLSLAQQAALVVIPNKPNSLRPGRYNQAIEAQRNKWLKVWAAQGLLADLDLQAALDEPFEAWRRPMPVLAPHWARMLKKKYPNLSVFHTTLDPNLQVRAQTYAAQYINRLSLQGIHNGAAIIVDNQSGNVLAYIGSQGFDSPMAGQIDGLQAPRSPGSTLKPLLYGLAFDMGYICAQTILPDVPTSFQGYMPVNFDAHSYGPVSVETALCLSLNIPAVYVLSKIGLTPFLDLLERAGFMQIQKDRRKLGIATILGGCSASLWELTGLYQSFEQGGVFRPLQMLKNQKNTNSTHLLSVEATYLMHQIMSKIVRPDIPKNIENMAHLPKVAWKTGTSFGRRDAWALGYSDRFTIGVWLGNFDNTGVAGLSGADMAAPMLFGLFDLLRNRQQYGRERKPPIGLKERMVCKVSGLVPAAFCKSVVPDYYLPLVSSSAVCNHLTKVYIYENEKYSYCGACKPSSHTKAKYYQNLSPEIAHYYKKRHTHFEPIPAHNPFCRLLNKDSGPKIISPQANHTYMALPDEPLSLLLYCQPLADIGRVYWYHNDRFLRGCPADSTFFISPSVGSNTVSCTDEKGRISSIKFDVVE